MRNLITVLKLALVAWVLSGCAVANGPAFTALAPLSPDEGNVYIYRKWAMQGAAVAHAVKVDGQRVAELPNSSHVLLRLKPGSHDINVGEFRSELPPSRLQLMVDPGKSYFIEFDESQSSVSSGAYLSIVRDRRTFAMRPEAKALEELRGLKRAN